MFGKKNDYEIRPMSYLGPVNRGDVKDKIQYLSLLKDLPRSLDYDKDERIIRVCNSIEKDLGCASKATGEDISEKVAELLSKKMDERLTSPN